MGKAKKSGASNSKKGDHSETAVVSVVPEGVQGDTEVTPVQMLGEKTPTLSKEDLPKELVIEESSSEEDEKEEKEREEKQKKKKKTRKGSIKHIDEALPENGTTDTSSKKKTNRKSKVSVWLITDLSTSGLRPNVCYMLI
jgi:hypothetical protein